MSGCWGCFDEFNRILLDVMSVITTFIDSIFQALKAGNNSGCTINDKSFKVNKNCGLFITMNPGYAGRQELPDNLAALFRPVAMMVPDYLWICKIELMAEGFQFSEKLSQKITTIFALMSRQLSKQFHYDYGMRAIKSTLRHSGTLKQMYPQYDEAQIVIKAIRDMIMPRFLAEDVILFDNLFIDLFPGQEEPDLEMDDLQIQIEQAMLRRGLVLNENIVVKCMQLFESKSTRHGNMLIGFTQSGKTTTWEILQEALNKLY
jgi:dynein heavy chain, axonemal